MIFRLVLSFLFFSTVASAQVTGRYTTANAHAHNDYEHKFPFTTAYRATFGSIEADIFLSHDSLLVGHTPADLVFKKTLEKLYLDPLREKVKLNNGFPYADSSLSLQLMIDIKTEAVSTLNAFISLLRQYPELISSTKLHFVITGNRPAAKDYPRYPSFILFDGEFKETYSDSALMKVPLFSGNLQTYISWNGHQQMGSRDKKILDSLISCSHALHKKIRFWNAPDFPQAWQQLIMAGVDYLNTDHIAEIDDYLRQANRGRGR